MWRSTEGLWEGFAENLLDAATPLHSCGVLWVCRSCLRDMWDALPWANHESAGSPPGWIGHGGRLRTVSAMPQLSVRSRDLGSRVRSHNSAPSHLLGHGAADAAQSSCSSGHLFRQLRAVQASHRKHPGTDRCDATLSGLFSKKKAEKIHPDR